ncbi:hypothetical protein [Anaerophaga thermohalophila]|uniref:hypothetical protein n=1 Tax=Anaerophaga thermohalophila TaxID=177400 RepID=UPI000237CFE9|nr:hypothetical protein [Anaerophaga thermohalophila]
MKLGTNIHSTNHKKAYRKPVLEVVEIDRAISLQGYSGVIPEPEVSSFDQNQITNTDNNKIFPESKNPFGGGTPNYDYDR